MKFMDNLYFFSRFSSNFLVREFHIVWMIFEYYFIRILWINKNTVLDYRKGSKFKNNINFSKVWIILQFCAYFSLEFNSERSTIKSIFFFTVLCIKAEKPQNTVLDYKKGSKFKNNMIFRKFGGWLYNNSAIIFHFNSFWKDLQSKAYFSLLFYA